MFLGLLHSCLRPAANWMVWVAFLGGWAHVGESAAQPANADTLKAEVVYRALMFVSWPADREAAGRSLRLCTLADGRLQTALQALQGRPIRHLTIDVRRLARPELAVDCQLVYLPAPTPAVKAVLADGPVLLVSDGPDMLDHGAMINLQIEDGRIVFDVELDAARRAGLDISTKLLRLARFVRRQQPSP